MTALLVPALLGGAALYAALRGVDVYAALCAGAKDGLRLVMEILPPLVVLLTAVTMLRASGVPDALARLLSPVLRFLGIPAECAPLMFLRPFSGSGALSVGSEVIRDAGADSLTGRIAAVMLGSSETSFYTIAVYSAYLKLKDTGCTLKAAMLADAAAFIMSGVAVRLLMK